MTVPSHDPPAMPSTPAVAPHALISHAMITHVRDGHRRIAAALAVALSLTPAIGHAAAPGLAIQAATGRSSAVTTQRIALLIVPQPAAASGRAATAHADEEAYRKRLRDIGFDVWTLGPADRPQLERGLREAVARLPEDVQIAVFALGPSVGGTDDVHILPKDAPSDASQRPDMLDSEGLRLSDLLRRISQRRARDLVAVVDECQPAAGGRCDFDAAAGASGASIIGSERAGRRSPSGAPLAGRASLREPMLGAMAQEGESFLQSFAFLRRALSDSDLEPRASGSLTTSFAFLPQGFFAGLPSACNRIDPNADPASLRGVNLDPPIGACEAATATYPYARAFEDRRQAGREQRAFQKATASCEDGTAIASYSAAYPAGRFRGLVDNFSIDCNRKRDRQEADERRRREETDRQREAERQRQEVERQRQEDERRRREELDRQREAARLEQERLERERQALRAPASSASGWTLNFASNLLEIRPMMNDQYDAQKQTYTTIWRSRQHGDQVMMYVQISPNERCGSAQQYIAEQIRPRRGQVSRSQEVNSAPGRAGFVLEGRGTAVAQGSFDDRSFYDFATVRRDDRSTIINIGARFPAEYSDLYRAELLRMMNSMQLPNRDIFTNRCG